MKLGLRRHANTHDPDKGSDPLGFLRDFIRFNYDNQGGYLDITARGFVPDDSDIALRIQTFAEDGGAGDFQTLVAGLYLLTAAAGLLISDGTGNSMGIGAGGIDFQLQTGSILVVRDGMGNPLVTYTG